MTLADFDPGWESSPQDEETDRDAEIQSDLADCLGVSVEVLDPGNPSADSPNFSSPTDEEVSASVTLTPSIEAAQEAMDLQRDPNMPGCFTEAVKALLRDNLLHPDAGQEAPDDLEIGEVTFNPISFATLGDDTLAYRATIPLSASGVSVDMYIDVVAVRIGRAGITGTFRSTFSPYSPDDAEGLLRIMIDRLPADT